MGSSAKKLVKGPLMLGLLLCPASMMHSTAVASPDGPEEAIFNQALKEAAQELKQQKKEQARVQKHTKRVQRLAAEFEILLSRAREQHTRIKQWQKVRSRDWKIYAKSVKNKRRLLVATTSPQ